jgi:hypothetical protein
MEEKIDAWNSGKHTSRSNDLDSIMVPSSKPLCIPSKLRRNRQNHGPRAEVPPAVAALLAVTIIPRPRFHNYDRRQIVKETFYGPIEDEDEGALVEDLSDTFSTLSSRSTLEMLLSPPDDDDYDSDMIKRSHSDGFLSVRSDSIESIPSLDTDNESTFSFSSSWSHNRKRSFSDPRTRILPSSPIKCDLEHPLMDNTAIEPPIQTPNIEFPSASAAKRATLRLTLVSNLTASFRVLKSAAKSFTNITVSAATIQPDDYLTRSIVSISPKYTDERWPSPTEEESTLTLRRYLNPWNATYDETPCTGAIQMLTYNLSKSGSSCRKGKYEISIGGEPSARQREARENADFLRIIVLEMNMRRGGKLSDTAHGKAKYMLPPRQSCKPRTIGDPGHWEARICIYDV